MAKKGRGGGGGRAKHAQGRKRSSMKAAAKATKKPTKRPSGKRMTAPPAKVSKSRNVPKSSGKRSTAAMQIKAAATAATKPKLAVVTAARPPFKSISREKTVSPVKETVPVKKPAASTKESAAAAAAAPPPSVREITP